MLTFTNMTPEEFLRLNADSIPPEVLKYLDSFASKISELEREVEELRRSDEQAWEQVSFARDLVEQLDHFAEFNLSKVKLKMYNYIRENTYFEI